MSANFLKLILCANPKKSLGNRYASKDISHDLIQRRQYVKCYRRNYRTYCAHLQNYVKQFV